MQVLHERKELGGHAGRVTLVHQSEAADLAICGVLELTIDGDRHARRAGNACYFDSRRLMGSACVGSEPCEVLTACTPPLL